MDTTFAAPAADIKKAPARPAAARLVFIDNIRWVMIFFVLSMHAAVTYSGNGGWYYKEHGLVSKPELFIFITYQAFLQSFFMGLLFFVAGYFVPGAYDKKGGLRFLRDRAFRLGLPTLLYILILGPVTEYVANGNWEGGPKLGGTGPLWFCEALLIFSVVYGLARAAGWRDRAIAPTGGGIAIFIAIMAAATFAVRISIDGGASVLNMHPGDFPQYILMYVAGAYGYRGDWLVRLADRACLRGAAIALILSVPLFAALIVFGGGLQGDTARYSGGFNPVSAGKCLWEALVCAGMGLLMLAIYRRHFNAQGALARFLSDNAFGVYLIHPPVLIAIAIALHPLAWPALAKAALLTILAAIGSFAASAFVLRKSPLRAIV